MEHGPKLSIEDFRAELDQNLWRCYAVHPESGAECFKTLGHTTWGKFRAQQWHTGIADLSFRNKVAVRWDEDGHTLTEDELWQ